MKLGVCSAADNAALIKKAGFDYIELPVFSYARLTEAEFDVLKTELAGVGLPVHAANFFFPADLKVTGPDVDTVAVMDYCRVAVSRSLELGVEILTVGSGKSRYCPDGFPKETAVKQFGNWLLYIADLLGAADCTVAVEPIRYQSTNILNTLEECHSLVLRLEHPHVKVMTDFQQLRAQGDSFDALTNIGSGLAHAHISDSHTLHCPASGSEDQYDQFFNTLRACGYVGALSVETTFYGVDLSPAYLRTMIDAYGL